MKNLTERLRSQRGATMLMALLLFLVAAMVSAVIISAALTGTKRVTDDYTYEQSYQTVSSAASFFSDTLVGSRACREVVTHKDDAGTRIPDSPVWSMEGSIGSSDALAQELLSGLKKAETFGGAFPEGEDSAFYEATFTVSAENFADVDVKLSIDREYNITLECTEKGGSVSSHRVVTELKCSVEDSVTDGEEDGVWREIADRYYTWELR